MKEYNLIPTGDLFNITSLTSLFYLKLNKNYAGYRERLGFNQLIYVDSGNFEYNINNEMYTLKAGQLLIVPADAERSGRSLNGTRCYIGVVGFNSDSEAMKHLKEERIFELSETECEVMRIILKEGVAALEPIFGDANLKGLRLRSDAKDSAMPLVAAYLKVLLTSLYARKYIKVDRTKDTATTDIYKSEVALVNEIKEYLSKHIYSNITLDSVSRDFNISISYLKRLFCEHEGSGVIDYYIRLKIERAKTLIRDSNMNFTQISARLQFCTIHYFSRIFKQKTGMTPSEYKNQVSN